MSCRTARRGGGDLSSKPNGFVLGLSDGTALRDLFIGLPAIVSAIVFAIIRLVQDIQRMIDRLPAAAH